MSSSGAFLELAQLRTSDLASLTASDWLVIWPVAALEQHGPHLPLGTDAIVLDAVVRQLSSVLTGVKALLLPGLPLGKSPEHLGYPGTISLRAGTLLAIAEDIVASCARHGFKRFVFLNGHGGNTALLQAVSPDLRYKYGVQIYHIDLWASPFFDDMIEKFFPQLIGCEVHAGSVETSLLLHLRPDLVEPLASRPSADALPSEVAQRLASVPCGWLAEDFGPSGVIGDPSQASADAGAAIFEAAVEQVCRLISHIYKI
jgi:creatinine amidohydrolase